VVALLNIFAVAYNNTTVCVTRMLVPLTATFAQYIMCSGGFTLGSGGGALFPSSYQPGPYFRGEKYELLHHES